MTLTGKHALITGASRGIGRGIALKLAQSGVKVAIHYYQNENAANQTLAEIRKRGSDGVLVQADVTRPEPEDIGNVATLLCSEQAGWITGQVIYADGGASLMNPEVPPEIQLG